MKKTISTLLLITFLTPATSFGDSLQDEPMVAPINQGQAAPFAGVLFNKPAAAKVTVEYKHDTSDLQVEIDRAVADAIAKKNKELSDASAVCTREKTELSAKIVSLNETLRIKQEENDSLKTQVENSPKRTTWFGLGFATGLVFTVATAFAIGQIVN